MNIRVIKRSSLPDRVYFRGSNIIEITENSADDHSDISVSVYDPAANTVSRILPDSGRINPVPVFNCIWNSGKEFFSFTSDNEGEGHTRIMFFDPENRSIRTLLRLEDDNDSGEESVKTTVFVMQDDQLLVQKEYNSPAGTEDNAARTVFSLSYHNITNGECIPVRDINIVNNGIKTIIPVSESDIMVKTGFNATEDQRIGNTQESALIEGVYCGSLSMFISSLPHENTSTGARLLASAYQDKAIMTPFVRGNYIIFDVVDTGNMTRETHFCSHRTEDILIFRNDRPYAGFVDDAFVINNIPYMKVATDNGCAFFNLLSQEYDCVFEDETFVGVTGKLFIFNGIYSGYDHVRIYRHPKLDLIHEEKGVFHAGCCSGDDYYIYISPR